MTCDKCGNPDSWHAVLAVMLSRVKAGEDINTVATDYGISAKELERVIEKHTTTD